VGRIRGGGITEHLAALQDATTKYLQQQVNPSEGLTGEEYRLLRQALESVIDPEDEIPQPEPLSILYMLRSSRTTYWGGGLWEQPYLLLLELSTCENAENAFMKAQRDAQVEASKANRNG
jgi:hypothetical protein